MCTNAGYLGHGSLEGMGKSTWTSVDEGEKVAAPLASKMGTNAGYLGHGSLEGMGVSHWPSVDEGEEVC
jgi:hypothetical protein